MSPLAGIVVVVLVGSAFVVGALLGMERQKQEVEVRRQRRRAARRSTGNGRLPRP